MGHGAQPAIIKGDKAETHTQQLLGGYSIRGTPRQSEEMALQQRALLQTGTRLVHRPCCCDGHERWWAALPGSKRTGRRGLGNSTGVQGLRRVLPESTVLSIKPEQHLHVSSG